MISKDKIFFDPTDVNTIADSDSIGAFVRAGNDGDVIASQNINSEDWLNTAAILHDDSGAVISDANPLPVDIKSGVNVEVDLSHVDDSVALGDGTNLLTSTTVGADIGLDVNIINAAVTVSATDLDIRDLTAASDSVAAYLSDGSGNSISSTSNALHVYLDDQNGDLDVNITNASIAVTANDLDIRDLTQASDNVAIGDSSSLFTGTTVGADYALDVNVVQAVDPSVANSSALTTAKSATSTQSALLSSELSGRKMMFVQNLGNRSIFIAENGAADAAATGLRLSPNAVAEFKIGPSVSLDVEAAGGTQDVRVFEAA